MDCRIQEEASARNEEPETLDPISDLRVTALELVVAIRERQALMQQRAAMPCHR